MKRSDALPDRFVAVLQQALESVTEERALQDERRFQGALLQELARRLERGMLPSDPLIEEEYQKTLPMHGITIRPDIIVHVPFERGLAPRRDQGNFVAIELKRRASAAKATDAFANLAVLRKVLHYPLTIFINIDSQATHSDLCPKELAGQTICFAVDWKDSKPVVRRHEIR
jgi:hypothetical protein